MLFCRRLTYPHKYCISRLPECTVPLIQYETVVFRAFFRITLLSSTSVCLRQTNEGPTIKPRYKCYFIYFSRSSLKYGIFTSFDLFFLICQMVVCMAHQPDHRLLYFYQGHLILALSLRMNKHPWARRAYDLLVRYPKVKFPYKLLPGKLRYTDKIP